MTREAQDEAVVKAVVCFPALLGGIRCVHSVIQERTKDVSVSAPQVISSSHLVHARSDGKEHISIHSLQISETPHKHVP